MSKKTTAKGVTKCFQRTLGLRMKFRTAHLDHPMPNGYGHSLKIVHSIVLKAQLMHVPAFNSTKTAPLKTPFPLYVVIASR